MQPAGKRILSFFDWIQVSRWPGSLSNSIVDSVPNPFLSNDLLYKGLVQKSLWPAYMHACSWYLIPHVQTVDLDNSTPNQNFFEHDANVVNWPAHTCIHARMNADTWITKTKSHTNIDSIIWVLLVSHPLALGQGARKELKTLMTLGWNPSMLCPGCSTSQHPPIAATT